MIDKRKYTLKRYLGRKVKVTEYDGETKDGKLVEIRDNAISIYDGLFETGIPFVLIKQVKPIREHEGVVYKCEA